MWVPQTLYNLGCRPPGLYRRNPLWKEKTCLPVCDPLLLWCVLLKVVLNPHPLSVRSNVRAPTKLARIPSLRAKGFIFVRKVLTPSLMTRPYLHPPVHLLWNRTTLPNPYPELTRTNGNGIPFGQNVPLVKCITIEELPLTSQSTIGPLNLVVILWTTRTDLVLSLPKRSNPHLLTIKTTTPPPHQISSPIPGKISLNK